MVFNLLLKETLNLTGLVYFFSDLHRQLFWKNDELLPMPANVGEWTVSMTLLSDFVKSFPTLEATTNYQNLKLYKWRKLTSELCQICSIEQVPVRAWAFAGRVRDQCLLMAPCPVHQCLITNRPRETSELDRFLLLALKIYRFHSASINVHSLQDQRLNRF